MMDISTCKHDAPILMSAPHYYNAIAYSLGYPTLNPEKEKHETIIEVEPWTGQVLRAKRRLMVSIELQHDEKNFPM